MANSYQMFLKKKIDLAPLGVEYRAEEPTYFCTPKGASMIGWAGVDGIHYCFIRGFGEMVFAVSPANTNPDYVHPLAVTFVDFLRLLLACGDAAALEQAWLWDELKFNQFLQENPPTQEQSALLAELADKLGLTPMEQPWQYIKGVQASFDYDKIKYTEDFFDPDMNSNAERKAPEWKVYFEGSFWGHSGRDRCGKELPIRREFQWAGSQWLIPAAYVCRKGLVLEFCRKVPPEQIQRFMDKWNLTYDNEQSRQFTHEQQMELDRDNPLCVAFHSALTLNRKELKSSHGCSITYNPCMPEGCIDQQEARWVIQHYELDPTCGWVFYRASYLWGTKSRPQIHTLSVTLEQRPIPVPGPHFHADKAEDQISFTLPQTGRQYTLTVQECERQQLPEKSFGHSPDMVYPRHFLAMSYTIEPELADGAVTIADTADSDQPKRAQSAPYTPIATTDAISIGIIGGADGPTSIVVSKGGQARLRTACSALHHEPAANVEWRITFYESWHSNLKLDLL